MMQLRCWIVALSIAVGVPQDPPKQDPPKTETATGHEEFSAVLVELKGVVDVKRPEDKEWIPASRNMKLPKSSEVCTGAASSAKLVFAKGLTVELRAVTMVNLVHLLKKVGNVTVDTTIKFGAAEIKLEKTSVKADMQVATPAVTTSISGSQGVIHGWAKGGGRDISLRVRHGNWHRRYDNGSTQNGGPGESFNDKGGSASDILNGYILQILEGFGRDESELDPIFFPFGDKPGFEFNSELFNPKAGQNEMLGKLPPPPGTP